MIGGVIAEAEPQRSIVGRAIAGDIQSRTSQSIQFQKQVAEAMPIIESFEFHPPAL